MPKVSIGLPVYNGENYISKAISSLLSQTFEDFELIICDNASTDKTETICREFEKKDRRVRYFRNTMNLGAAPNFNLCVELATGVYFKWAAHDDICLPDYLQRCVDHLDQNPDTVLCHSNISLIDEYDDIISSYTEETGTFSATDPLLRFANAIDERHQCISVFGVIRRDRLLRTTLIGSYIGSDRNLIAQLALMGRIVHTPHTLFLSRDHGERSVRAISVRDRGYWFNTSRSASGELYHWVMLGHNVSALINADIQNTKKLSGLLVIIDWLRQSNMRKMVLELRRFVWNRTPFPAVRAMWRKRMEQQEFH